MAFRTKPKSKPPEEQEEFVPVWGNAFGIDQDDLPAIIPTVVGKILEIWPQKPLKKKQGEDTTIQNGTIETEAGEIKFVIFGNDELPKSVKGKVLRFSSAKGKGGLGGVEYNLNKYNDVISEQLVLSYRAEIEEEDGSTVSSPKAEAAPPKAQATATANHPARAAQPKQAAQTTTTVLDDNASDFEKMERGVQNIIRIQQYIDAVVRAAYAEYEYPEETLVSYTMNAVITAEHLGAFDLRITRQSPKDAPVSHEEPETTVKTDQAILDNWAAYIIPIGPKKGDTLVSLGKLKIFELNDYRIDNGKKGEFWDVISFAADTLAFEAKKANEDLESKDDLPW